MKKYNWKMVDNITEGKIKKSHKEYNIDYYENGISSGKSCYMNYRWLPELTIKLAHQIIKTLNLREGDKVLDFGCAKGFLVKALRILDIEAYGCDTSKYAIQKVDLTVKEVCKLSDVNIPFDIEFEWIISKDVFEHCYEEELDIILKKLLNISNNLFVVVPLGKNDKFIIPAYELDKTHKLAKSKEWWEDKFEQHGWHVNLFSFNIPGIKDSWIHYKEGNGFFNLKRLK